MNNLLYKTLNSWNMDKNIVKIFYLAMEKKLNLFSKTYIPINIELAFNKNRKNNIQTNIKFLSETGMEYKRIFFDKNDTKSSIDIKFSIGQSFLYAPYVPPIILSPIIYNDTNPVSPFYENEKNKEEEKEEISFSEFFNTLKLFTN